MLHFPPSPVGLADGELVLIDAGAECRGYASDITRTYPASGEFSAEQQELHAIVERRPPARQSAAPPAPSGAMSTAPRRS